MSKKRHASAGWHIRLGIFANPPCTGPDLVSLVFDKLQTVKSGESAKELATTIEEVKTFLSENFKWTPILYEMGKVARKYKTKKSEKLDLKEVEEFKINLQTWKAKLIAGK